MTTSGVGVPWLLLLPLEVQDEIWEKLRTFSHIDVVNMPNEMLQPAISKVSHNIRSEALDIFYRHSRFMIDLRRTGSFTGYYPISPDAIFNRWITAIGDAHTAQLRNLSFYVYNFAVFFAISPPTSSRPAHIALRFRQINQYLRVSVEADVGYTAKVAVSRAEAYLQHNITGLVKEIGMEPLRVKDVQRLGEFVEAIRPALCTSNGLGWRGATLEEDPQWMPKVARHLFVCAQCRNEV